MTKLSNQEKSARRYGTLTQIAEQTFSENQAFREFLIAKAKNGDPVDPTWRRLETFIKQQFESGASVKIIIESSGGV